MCIVSSDASSFYDSSDFFFREHSIFVSKRDRRCVVIFSFYRIVLSFGRMGTYVRLLMLLIFFGIEDRWLRQ